MVAHRQPAIVSWIGITNTSAVEVIAGVGFDWLLIDTEPNPMPKLSDD